MGLVRVKVLVPLVLVLALTAGACGSSAKKADETPVTAPPTTAPPASVLPSTTTTVGTAAFAPTCSALTSALEVEELQPKNTGNWSAERQRIITDTATNAALYDSAKEGAPADIASSLTTLAAYSRHIGTSVSSATSFAAAVTAIGAYPDKVGASLATSTVGSWRRANCR